MNTSSETQFELASQTAALFSLPNHRIFRISGNDHLRYLHGRLSQDIKGIQVGTGAKSLMLSPQGKIQGQMLLLRLQDSMLMISDPLTSENIDYFLKNLLCFKVADQVEVEFLQPESTLVSLQGPAVAALATELKFPLLAEKNYQHHEISFTDIPLLLFNSRRSTAGGLDLIVESKSLKTLLDNLLSSVARQSILKCDTAVAEMLRITAGIPEFGRDLSEKISAPEIKLEELVSFSKGCYAGQEVVEMTIARGRPNRSLVQLKSKTEQIIDAGTELFATPNDGEKAIGYITSSCYFPTKQSCECLGFIKTNFNLATQAFYAINSAKVIQLAIAN